MCYCFYHTDSEESHGLVKCIASRFDDVVSDPDDMRANTYPPNAMYGFQYVVCCVL